MALSDDEREFWRAQASAGVKAPQIAEAIRKQRASAGDDAPEKPPRQYNNTGPDVAEHLYSEARKVGGQNDYNDEDVTGREVERFRQTVNPTAEEAAHGFAQFGVSMLAPGALGMAAGKVLPGAVARSAARAPGAFRAAMKGAGEAATHDIGKQALVDMVAHQAGIPHGTITALRVAPHLGRAAGIAGDEALGAVGRLAGYKPYSPVSFSQPVPVEPDVINVGPMSHVPKQLGPMQKALGPIDEAVPEPIGDVPTKQIPVERNADVAPRGRGEGVDLAASKAKLDELPDDTAALDKTQRIVTDKKPGWSRNAKPGTAYEAPLDATPSDTNVTPKADESAMSPKMKAYRQRLADAEDQKFADQMGMTLPEYKAMLKRRSARLGENK